MKRKRHAVTADPEFVKKQKEQSRHLLRCIYECACPTCGAQPEESCRSRPIKRTDPPRLSSPAPHIARVRAGHDRRKALSDEQAARV